MKTTLLANIHSLIQVAKLGELRKKGIAMQDVAELDNAWLLIEGTTIKAIGKMEDGELPRANMTIDCTDRLVMPGFVDCHTHVVFAQLRQEEYVMKLKGQSYEDIAAAGGGILNSASRLQRAPIEKLVEDAALRLNTMLLYGTTAVEIKTGYGLTVEAELKMLRAIRQVASLTPMTVKATLLGAHALPAEYKQNRAAYIDLVCKQMIPAAAAEGLADYVDVFCETGFFTPQETELILNTGAKYGLKGRVHANELACSGGVQAAVKCNALSADHLECLGEEEITALQNSEVMPVLLPGTAFFLNIDYAPARKLLAANLPVALASDFNPGTCPSGNLQLVMSIACNQMRMLPAEALTAVTLNAAAALELSHTQGSLENGKLANLLITNKLPSLAALPYLFGANNIDRIILNGELV